MMERFYHERNSSKSTRITYNRSVRYYTELTGHTLEELLQICEDEEITVENLGQNNKNPFITGRKKKEDDDEEEICFEATL